MAKKIEVYFKSENDAESAHAALKKLKVNDVYIEEIPGDTDTGFFVPFSSANVGSSSGAAGYSGTAGTAGSAGGPIAPFAPIVGRDNDEDHDHGKLTHLMHFNVEEEDFDETVSILIDNDGYGNNED